MESCCDKVELIGDILTEKELNNIIAQMTKPGSEIIDYHLRTAADEGVKGFIGDHFRLTVSVRENDCVQKIYLFVKTVPLVNKPRADLVINNHFFTREALMYKLFEEIQDMDDQNPWHTKAFVPNEKTLVMPDLSIQGYMSYPVQNYLDKNHVLAIVSSLARFHASFAKYFREKSINKGETYNFSDEYGDIMTEPFFCESPWLRVGAKLANDYFREFSSKSEQYQAGLEKNISELFIRGCESVKEYKETLNVLVHKDLWANNILFRYTGDEVTDALLLDFQGIRYAPPAFDVVSLLYLTTSRSFRDRYENEVLHYYYSIFSENLDDLTNKRLLDLKYDRDAFLVWCKKARLFGMVQAITIFPFVMMNPSTAQKTFDNPETYLEYLQEDRSAPIIAYAQENLQYRNRLLEVCEEFIENYITK